MSIEGPGLYQDDTGHDVRSEFRDLIGNGEAPDEATTHLLKAWADVLHDEDVYCAFYLALADTQWRLGRPIPVVSQTALAIIDSGRDLRRWEYSPPFHRKRKKVLEDLRARLTSPPQTPRAVRKQADFATALIPGDVIRYKTATGDEFLIAVVGVNDSNNQRIALVRPLDWDGASSAESRDLATLRLMPDAQPLALFPRRGMDLPPKRSEVLLRDWPVPPGHLQDSLVGCSLVSWGVNLDPQLMRYRRRR